MSNPVAVATGAVLTAPKVASRWTGWQQRSNHVGHLWGVAELIDFAGITLPGLTMQLEIKAHVSAVSCLYLFSVMRLVGKERRIVYQLEVCPAEKRSHNGTTPIYGPHEHTGDAEPYAVGDPSVNCSSWAECLQWFFVRAGIVPCAIPDPFTP